MSQVTKKLNKLLKVTQVTKNHIFSLLSISHFTIKEKIVAKKQIIIFLTKFCSDFGNVSVCI